MIGKNCNVCGSMMRIFKCITVCFLCLLIHLSFIIATAVCSPWRPSLPVSSLLYSTAFSSLSFSPCLALSQTLEHPVLLSQDALFGHSWYRWHCARCPQRYMLLPPMCSTNQPPAVTAGGFSSPQPLQDLSLSFPHPLSLSLSIALGQWEGVGMQGVYFGVE